MTKLRWPLDVRGDVLVGKNGELYLAGGNHSILKYAEGAKLPALNLSNLAANIAYRKEISAKHGARFAHIIAPEKYMVFRDSFPIEAPGSMAQQFFEAGHTGAIYPVQLLSDPGIGRTYAKTDTHWTPAALAAISRLIASVAEIGAATANEVDQRIRAAIKTTDEIFYGDLGRKLTPQVGEARPVLSVSADVERFENGVAHDFASPVNDGRLILIESRSAATEKTLLIFGDSYLFHALDYLPFYFKRIVFLRTRFLHEEIVSMVRPAVVISQMAERYLTRVDLDTRAPPFFFVPHLLGRTPQMTAQAAKAFALAFSSGREIDVSVFDKMVPKANG